jgi:hypothetical protein
VGSKGATEDTLEEGLDSLLDGGLNAIVRVDAAKSAALLQL